MPPLKLAEADFDKALQNYSNDELIIQNDSVYNFQKSRDLFISPSLGIAFNQKNKNFHQISFSNFRWNRQDQISNYTFFPNRDTRNKVTQFTFGYAYNFALWRKSKKWLPFIGIGTKMHYSRVTSKDNNSNAHFKNLSLKNFLLILKRNIQKTLKITLILLNTLFLIIKKTSLIKVSITKN